ncbi:threonine dehydratase [Bartonella australis AUST/NH1]|uniref:L-threonine dehydratase n=1 Tax=Bartonella australis (strain Aust/NH1) TaxID=1094489 RepID=M1N452_BARAA|nr:threonine ammonia-lyase IlvA [Bartonella australis]AGF74679.1 threonine dehydratase [Bartonella australis AUST/NH1]
MNKFVQDVSKVMKALHNVFTETPLQRNDFLSQKYDAEIYLKREDLTPVRSYKIRGALNFVSQMLDKIPQDAAFVCASAGNHAQGVAFACRHFKRKGIIFMPTTTPQQKVEKTRIFGKEFIEIRLVGHTFDQCYAAARYFVAEGGGVMAPPFDDIHVITGQATVLCEAALQWEKLNGKNEPDLIIVPVGGGGLASGVSNFLREYSWKTKLRFVEPQGAASLSACLNNGRHTKLDDINTFVDGAAVAEIGTLNYAILKQFLPDSVITVPENRVCFTMVEMLNIEGVVLEPAGALSIDALNSISRRELKGKKILLVVSGGNFDFERLPDIKERALRFQGLRRYFIFSFPQHPGALRSFLTQLSPDDDIVRFEYLKKSARNFGSVLIAIETKKYDNFSLLEKKFKTLGWRYHDITHDQTLFDFVV